jgi:hypothetical protein
MWRLALAVLVALAWPSLAAAQISAAFLQTAEDATAQTTYTYAAHNLGAAASDRMITVVSHARKTGPTTCTAPTVTIGGVSATAIVSQGNNVSNCNIMAIHKATVPTGTTGTIALTYGATMLRSYIAVYRSTGAQALVASSSGSSTADDPTGALTIGATGYAVGGAFTTSTSATATWTGLTEQYDTLTSGSTVNAVTGGFLAPSTLQSGITVTVDWSTAAESVGVWAAWAPIVNATSPTHYVTPTGNPSGSCSSGDPCTLTRAFALAGSTTMPPGSWVTIDNGVYSQDEITTTGGGVSGYPVRFVGQGTDYSTGTRITGTRTQLTAVGFTKTAGQTYVYQHASPGYTVSHVCQRPTASTWTPIEVDDRTPPAWNPSNRVYFMTETVCYTREDSIDEVDETHCSYVQSGGTVYVHMCHEGVPADADEVYAGSSGWGHLLYTGSGDYLTLEQATLEHTGNGDGLNVQPSAAGNQFKHMKFIHARVWIEGINTILEDSTLTGFAAQGTDNPHANCYSDDYGDRSCWGENGDGYLLLMGRQGTSTTYNQIARRLVLRSGWNLMRMDGANTFEYNSLWGCANHNAQISGTGGTFRHNTMSDCQDSGPYVEGESFNNVTIEHNIIYNAGPWMWCSRDGASNGSVCPTAVTIRYNIFGSVLYDTLTATGAILTHDCNVFIPRVASPSSIARITTVDGGGGAVSSATLAAWQAATVFDDNSVELPYTYWLDQTNVFANFAGQQTYPNDFTLSAAGVTNVTVCGVRAGPDTLAVEGDDAPVSRRLRFRVP